jgi:hypothetical protein
MMLQKHTSAKKKTDDLGRLPCEVYDPALNRKTPVSAVAMKERPKIYNTMTNEWSRGLCNKTPSK